MVETLSVRVDACGSKPCVDKAACDTCVECAQGGPEPCTYYNHNCAGFVFTVVSDHGVTHFTFGGEIRPNEWLNIIKAFENKETLIVPNHPMASDKYLLLKVNEGNVHLCSHTTVGSFEQENYFIFSHAEAQASFAFIKDYIEKNEDRRCF